MFTRWTILTFVLLAQSANAQTTQPLGLEGVGVVQKLGAKVPLDLAFADESGRSILLRNCFHGRPVILVPVYYQCPMLCSMTLNDLTRNMNGVTESAGREFDVVTFSFDPREHPDLAAAKRRQYLRAYGRASAEDGWRFLTGGEGQIKRLTDSIGFNFHYDAVNNVYAHPAAVVVLTPDGTISRYFLGEASAVDLRHAIADAGASRVAEATPQAVLYCFRYDPTTGKYGLIISRALRLLAVGTVLSVAGLVGWNLRRERLAGRTRASTDTAGGPP